MMKKEQLKKGKEIIGCLCHIQPVTGKATSGESLLRSLFKPTSAGLKASFKGFRHLLSPAILGILPRKVCPGSISNRQPLDPIPIWPDGRLRFLGMLRDRLQIPELAKGEMPRASRH